MKTKGLLWFACLLFVYAIPNTATGYADVVSCTLLKSSVVVPPGDATSLIIDSTAMVPARVGFVEYCDVAGHLDTEIKFQLRLPTDWNGKFLMAGNGAFAGSFGTLIPGLNYKLTELPVSWQKGPGHYAVAGTDGGYSGASSLMIKRPDRLANWQYRAVHLVAMTAKLLIKAYYGTAPSRSYMNSCSGGGRQALIEATRYPEDFDGIIAAAPGSQNAGDFQIWVSRALFPNGPAAGLIPTYKVRLLSKKVLEKCDALDGIPDGLVNDPVQCNFSPVADLPRCPNDLDREDCFTAAQVAALEKVHQGPSSNGKPLGPPYYFHGSEDTVRFQDAGQDIYQFSYNASGFPDIPRLVEAFGTGIPSFTYSLGTQRLRLVFNDPAFLLQNFSYDNPAHIEALNSWSVPAYAVSPDLSAFVRRGGKVILWHGWADSVINPMNSLWFYQQGLEALGGLERARESYRLFLVPGTQHCGGGNGPGYFDYPVTELDQWVEKGIAPESIIGRSSDSSLVRPTCPYPEVARLKEPGLDPNIPTSFVCAR